MATLTPHELSKRASISKTTIRTYSRELQSLLSPAANPPKGKPRRYHEHEVAIFYTASIMRKEGHTWETVIASLQNGEFIEPAPPDEPEPIINEDMPASPMVPYSAFEKITSLWQDERRAHDETRRHLMETEKRATAAETELKVLREQDKAIEPYEQPRKKSWLARLLGL